MVWHSSLTQKNEYDLERIQKAALRVILKGKYLNYGEALATLKVKSLKERRDELCLKFAKNCLKVEKFRKFFPLNQRDHCMTMRKSEMFAVKKCGSERYQASALPYMKRLLNKYKLEKKQLLSAIEM